MKTPDPAVFLRLARGACVALAVVLAGCQNLASQAPAEQQQARHAGEFRKSIVWLEEDRAEEQAPQDIWERIRRGFQLQEQIANNPRVEHQRLWFASKPSYLGTVSGRGSLYIHYVVERLEERNMPLELALLPVIESAYDPFAYSRSHAAGLWQFIPTTGRHYNLQQTHWYDGRRDITASTRAALNYLDKLHGMFNGDWLLALAAYNAGEGTVSRAIERNQKLGLPTDYWNLPLPKETQDYVPKLLALSQLVNAPQAYGLDLDPIANEPYFEVVEFKQQMNLARLAALADIDADELYQLNPAFKKRITYGGPQRLLVPVDKAEQLHDRLAQIDPKEQIDWQEYRVRRGDTLQGIAARYHVSVETLKELNHLADNRLSIGQPLALPLLPGERPQQSPFPASGGERSYRVKNGDNLWQIARVHSVSVADIKRWNRLSGNDLKVGQTLKLQGGGNSVTYYKVRKGDSLALIAKRFNVDLKSLQRWNPGSARLQPGQTLTLYLGKR